MIKSITRIEDGHKEPVEFVHDAIVLLRIVDNFLDHVGDGGRRDPFTSVNTCRTIYNQVTIARVGGFPTTITRTKGVIMYLHQ